MLRLSGGTGRTLPERYSEEKIVGNLKANPNNEYCALVLELKQSFENRNVVFTVTCERPGRQGKFSRSWSNHSGSQLSAPQAADLASWCAKTVESAIVALNGVQEVLT